MSKLDIEKFDGKISFAIWRVQMLAVLTQNGLKKVLAGKMMRPTTMTEEQWDEMDEKALSAIQLCLSREVLREVINEKSTAGIWGKLESLYMTKSLANKLRLKERLFTLRMSEGTPIQSHLDEFNSIIIDLENLDVKIDDEDKAVLLIVSLPPSHRQFKEIMLYGNYLTLSFDDVKTNLLAKEKFDTQIHSESSGEGLVVRGRNHCTGRRRVTLVTTVLERLISVNIAFLVSRKRLVFLKPYTEPKVLWIIFIRIFGVLQKFPPKVNVVI